MKRKMDKLIFRQTEISGKFAAVYVRVSSNDLKRCPRANKEKVFRESVRTQEADGIAKAISNNWEYRVFSKDCNVSGFESEQRVDLNEIQSLIKTGKIHTVIARDPYRLSRNAALSSDLLYKCFLKYGVNLIFLDVSIDISTPEGQESYIGFGLKGQAQLQYTSRSSLRNKIALAESGGYSEKPPIGWRMASRERNAVEQIPEQIVMVTRIFTEYAAGKSISRIIAGLKTDGFKRPVAGNSDWSIGDVGRLLRRVQYIGKITFQGKEYSSPYTPIIDMDTWHIVQAKLKENSKCAPRGKGSRWLASGLLRCGYCEDRKAAGQPVRFGNMHVSIAANANGDKKYPLYLCAESHRYGKKTCPGATISQIVIDDFIHKIIACYAVNGIKDTINVSDIDQDIADAEKEVERLNRTKDSLITGFVVSGGTPSDLAVATRKINAAIDATSRKMDENRSRILALSNRDAQGALHRLEKWDSLETQVKRDLLKKIINHISVYSDRVMVYTRMNPTLPITYKVKRVWRSKVILMNEFDEVAMGWHIALDYSTEREEEK